MKSINNRVISMKCKICGLEFQSNDNRRSKCDACISKLKTRVLKHIYPDENLSRVVGTEPLQNKDFLRKIWSYIKDNQLIK